MRERAERWFMSGGPAHGRSVGVEPGPGLGGMEGSDVTTIGPPVTGGLVAPCELNPLAALIDLKGERIGYDRGGDKPGMTDEGG